MKTDAFIYTGDKKFTFDGCETGADKDEKARKDDYVKRTQENLTKISALQEKLYADGREGLILVLQARDAAGKDSSVKHVMSGLNPQGVDVVSFKTPSGEELAHDFLWRIEQHIPQRGKIGIFNRSHYEDVLIVRVRSLQNSYRMPARCVDKDFFDKRYAHIRHYEEYLYDSGYRMIKVFLNVSRDEQKKRFLERIENEEKNWKFNAGDIDERALWRQYNEAYEDAVNKTATKHCPWYVLPADNKWYTRYLLSEILLNALRDIDPQFPQTAEDTLKHMEDIKQKLLNEK